MNTALIFIGVLAASGLSKEPSELSAEQMKAAIEAQLMPVVARDEGREARWSIAFESIGETWRWREVEVGANGTDRYVYQVAARDLIHPPTVISLEGGGHRVRLECRTSPCILVDGERAGIPFTQRRRVNFWPVADEPTGHRVVELLSSVMRPHHEDGSTKQ